MTGQSVHTILSSDDASSVSSNGSMMSYNMECLDNQHNNDDDLNNRSNHSNSSISSFLSTLLSDHSVKNEFGGPIKDLKICIVQDNATSEQYQHHGKSKSSKQPIKLVKLERSTSRNRMCRWGGGGSNSEVGSGSGSTTSSSGGIHQTCSTMNGGSHSSSFTRRQSDPCLLGLKKHILKAPKRRHLSPQQEPHKIPIIRNRPSMMTSSVSDSSLLRMPLRTESPRITRYTMSGNHNKGKIDRSSESTYSTHGGSTGGSSNSNASWNTISEEPAGKIPSKDIFQQLASTLPYHSPSASTASASSSSSSSPADDNMMMLGREQQQQKRRNSRNNNGNMNTFPPVSASAKMHQQSRLVLGGGLLGSGGSSSPSLSSTMMHQPQRHNHFSLSSTRTRTTTTTDPAGDTTPRTANGTRNSISISSGSNKNSNVIRNPAMMGLDIVPKTTRTRTTTTTTTSRQEEEEGRGRVSTSSGSSTRKAATTGGTTTTKKSTNTNTSRRSNNKKNGGGGVIKDASALGLKVPSSSSSRSASSSSLLSSSYS
mmetsp:Transcript_99905/g.149674  ORF Transcript_99905/g.149674 Transcript_99905/m.149674 type:complete len:539 (+) Transcript_99905:125-1741(+)